MWHYLLEIAQLIIYPRVEMGVCNLTLPPSVHHIKRYNVHQLPIIFKLKLKYYSRCWFIYTKAVHDIRIWILNKLSVSVKMMSCVWVTYFVLLAVTAFKLKLLYFIDCLFIYYHIIMSFWHNSKCVLNIRLNLKFISI